jgi:cation:H+ antiporter
LLLGLGWSVVVLIALIVALRRSGRGVRELVPESGYRVELRFLAVASVVAFVVPLTGQINLLLEFALLGFFAFYLWKASRNEAEAPELVGPAAHLGVLPARAPSPASGQSWRRNFWSAGRSRGGYAAKPRSPH